MLLIINTLMLLALMLASLVKTILKYAKSVATVSSSTSSHIWDMYPLMGEEMPKMYENVERPPPNVPIKSWSLGI